MEAECSDDVMKLRIKFNATFAGLIYSAGKASQNAATAINCNFRHSEYLLQVSLFMFQTYHSHSFKTLIVHSLQNPLSSSGNMLLLQLVSVLFSFRVLLRQWLHLHQWDGWGRVWVLHSVKSMWNPGWVGPQQKEERPRIQKHWSDSKCLPLYSKIRKLI